MQYVRSSNFFKYFVRESETGLFLCKICAGYGRETICANRTYHMRQQHRRIYLREKERVTNEREIVEED